ncbi:hypothetical protein BDW74DRAFT_179198 [Aspergillus multicolor]|uniref:uncharacterized protein n=1 Tax=Aspergillus multicolor TaxID=41759 RepID=UPI003CCC95EE
MQILRHDRCDEGGVRFSLPFLLLELSRDQELYNSAHWWYLAYEWAGGPNTEIGWIADKDADVFEEMHGHSPAIELWGDLDILVAFISLSAKLYLDLKALQGITESAAGRVPKSAIILNDKKLLDCEDYTAKIKILRWQLRDLYRQIYDLNEHFWGTFLAGDDIPVPALLHARVDNEPGRLSKAVEMFGRCRGYFHLLLGAPDATKAIKEEFEARAARDDEDDDQSDRGELVRPPVKIEP